MAAEIEPFLRKLINEIRMHTPGFCPDRLSPDTEVDEELDLTELCDSLDRIEIAIHVEEEFDVSIHEDEADNLRTYGELVRFVERTVSASQAT
jgi:acyl carrier protein